MTKVTHTEISRRQLLIWSTPVVTAIALPAHAVTSVCPGPPQLVVQTAPKCAGDPPVGTAVIDIVAIDDCPVSIKELRFTTSDPKSDLGDLPTFPVDATDVDVQSFTWTGPASDAATCLPLDTMTVELDYCCGDGPTLTESYDLTQLLANSIP